MSHKHKQAIRGGVKKKSQKIKMEFITQLLMQRWVRWSVLLVIISGSLMSVEWEVKHDEAFPIETVLIEGEFRYLSKPLLKDHALPYVSGGFFSVNLVQVRDALMQLPWVQDVSIRRQWPDALNIRVIEKQPVAFWGEDKLISSKAVLFQPESIDEHIQLPILSGPEGQHENMLKELSRMQAWLLETGLVISKINQDARRSWVLYMESGLELRLGRNNQHERLHRFVDVYSRRLVKQKENIKHIDMRYTNGLAVAWKDRQQGQGV